MAAMLRSGMVGSVDFTAGSSRTLFFTCRVYQLRCTLPSQQQGMCPGWQGGTGITIVWPLTGDDCGEGNRVLIDRLPMVLGLCFIARLSKSSGATETHSPRAARAYTATENGEGNKEGNKGCGYFDHPSIPTGFALTMCYERCV